jgi:transposase-like protein
VDGIENDVDSQLEKSIPAVKKYFRNLYLYDQLLRSITDVEDINENIISIVINEFMKKTDLIPDFSKFKADEILLEKIKAKIEHNCKLL